MALGIIWGMASVMVLLAVAGGFERAQQKSLGAFGDRFVLVRLNRAELDRARGGEERRLMMDALDVERLRVGAPAIRRLSPMNMAYGAQITGGNGSGRRVAISGSLPELAQIRNLPLAEGRFLNEFDELHRRRVIVLGPQVRAQLFGKAPAVGRKVRVAGFSTAAIPAPAAPLPPALAGQRGATPQPSRAAPGSTPAAPTSPTASTPATNASTARTAVTALATSGVGAELFEVIGVLADVEVQKESYVSISRNAFVPFSTSCAVFDDRFNIMLLEPRSPADKDLALAQFRQVMGARYGFSPDDENAVLLYFDAIGRAQAIEAVFRGVELFLALVGAAILLIGAVGLMNVVLVSLAARRFEIGLRKALGATPLVIATQVFLETALACVASGGLGFILGAGAIFLFDVLPLPEGFSRPSLDPRVAGSSFALLAAVAITASVYPAWRAARLTPVEALRSKG